MKLTLKIIGLLIVLLMAAYIGRLTNQVKQLTPTPVDTSSIEYLFSGYIDTGVVDTGIVVPTTGAVTVTYEPQPTKLAGNYQDNGTILRQRASKNVKTLDIPVGAQNVTITFKFHKMPAYRQEPGNIQAFVGTKKLCNGRLAMTDAMVNVDDNSWTYNFTDITTQDHPKGADWSYAIGRTLVIQAWIGESKNYIENITVSWTL